MMSGTQKPLRFGLIGTGRIGQVHASSIARDADAVLARVADPFIEGATAIAQAYGAIATDSAEELLAAGDLDAVVIASPTPTHVDLIRRAVELGIPALCEKPIDLDITRVDALRPVVAAAGVPVALGFNRRLDPSFSAARERVAADEIGRLEQLTIISRDPAPPPAAYVGVSGGIFRDMTIHDFDMARFFLPDIVEVTATGSRLFDEGANEHGDFDTAVTTMRAASGAQVTIINSRHSTVGYDQRLEAFGERGSLSVSNAVSNLVTASTAAGSEQRAPFEPFFLQRYDAAYRAELREFVSLINGGPSKLATFEDGRAALVLADAAHASANERRVITVSL